MVDDLRRRRFSVDLLRRDRDPSPTTRSVFTGGDRDTVPKPQNALN